MGSFFVGASNMTYWNLHEVASLEPDGNVTSVKGLTLAVGYIWNDGFSCILIDPYLVDR